MTTGVGKRRQMTVGDDKNTQTDRRSSPAPKSSDCCLLCVSLRETSFYSYKIQCKIPRVTTKSPLLMYLYRITRLIYCLLLVLKAPSVI